MRTQTQGFIIRVWAEASSISMVRSLVASLPVSYTHLDVYKRQGGKCVSGGAQFQIQQIGAAAGAYLTAQSAVFL